MTDVQTTPVVKAQQLYRMYDADGALLYIGISYSAISRYAQHKATQPWIGDVCRIEIETHEVSRAEIETIERDAIIAEKPKHNKQHNAPPRGPVRMVKDAGLPGYTWLAIGDMVALGLRGGECPIGKVLADSASDPRLPDGHVLLGLVNFFTGEIGGTQRLVNVADVVLGKSAGLMSIEDKTELGFRPQDVIYDTDALGDFQTDWKRRNKGTPNDDNDDLPAGEPTIVTGSNCRHATLGRGRVFDRQGQRRFHVSFDEGDYWVDRFDEDIIRWDP